MASNPVTLILSSVNATTILLTSPSNIFATNRNILNSQIIKLLHKLHFINTFHDHNLYEECSKNNVSCAFFAEIMQFMHTTTSCRLSDHWLATQVNILSTRSLTSVQCTSFHGLFVRLYTKWQEIKLKNVLEISAYIKGRSLLGIKAVDIQPEVCDIYGEGQLSHRTVCRWVAKISAGQQQLKDAARPGRPATTTTNGNIEKIQNILKTDARFTIRQLARMTN